MFASSTGRFLAVTDVAWYTHYGTLLLLAPSCSFFQSAHFALRRECAPQYMLAVVVDESAAGTLAAPSDDARVVI